jgi:hypothetical protein
VDRSLVAAGRSLAAVRSLVEALLTTAEVEAAEVTLSLSLSLSSSEEVLRLEVPRLEEAAAAVAFGQTRSS